MSTLYRAVACIVLCGQSATAQPPVDSIAGLIKQRIRASSPVLAERRAQIDLALTRRSAAGFRPPATASAEVEEVPGLVNLIGARSMRVDFSQQLIPSSTRRAEQAISDRDVDRAQAEFEITGRAIDAFVDQLVAGGGSATAIASRLSSEDSLLRGAEDALRVRFAVGDARYVDVLRLRTERLRIETEIYRGNADARAARRRLLRLASASDTADLDEWVSMAIRASARRYLQGTLPPLQRIDTLLSVSGTRQLATIAVERAQAERRLLALQQRTTFSASLGLQRFANDRGGSSLGITAGVSLPLAFTARRANDARLAVAEQQIAVARSKQVSTESRTVGSVAAAGDRYETARAQVAAFDAALLRGAREEREAALAAYRTGSMTLIELLDFERALAQAEVARIRSLADAADALLDLLTSALGIDDIDALLSHSERSGSRKSTSGDIR